MLTHNLRRSTPPLLRFALLCFHTDYGDMVARSARSPASGTATDYAVLAAAHRAFESPVQRYTRLRAELDDLAAQLAEAGEGSADPVSQESGGALSAKELVHEVSTLSGIHASGQWRAKWADSGGGPKGWHGSTNETNRNRPTLSYA